MTPQHLIRRFVAGLAVAAALLVAAVTLAAPARADENPVDLTATSVTVTASDGTRLGATIYAPRRATGPLPGLVLVHGSGNSKQDSVRAEALAFARTGIAVLTYDKRQLDAPDYSLLADDALRALATLRTQEGVDPAQVGMWGISEGGWVVPLAAEQTDDVAFVILASASGLSPIRTQTWNMRNKLANADVSGSLARTLSDRTYRVADDAGMFAESGHDPVPALAALTRPVLAVYGTTDTQVPAAESAAILRETVRAPLTLRFLPDAGHTLRVLDDTGDTTETLVAGYADAVGTWVRAVTGATPPTGESGPTPVQERTSVPLSDTQWWESWNAQLTALGLLLFAFLSYPIVAAVRRIRRAGVPVGRAARVLAVTGPLTVIGFVVYFVTVLDGADWRGIYPGPTFAGRPVLWLGLQLGALVTVVAAAITAYTWRTAGKDRVRLGVLLAGGGLFVPWALYWGLLLP
ncbi:alpha/beta hydrolase family protein [Cryptosporangium aurantiacum]|uniref:alpha/beta hydrolase family protein n=1 Tax=Cryptosporangium aurantiacum TaxID=134849 RepID=UPI001160F2E2|nr:prolyl oligopeptidase family serine peptidase [Cryptosporangium aurantiacum]